MTSALRMTLSVLHKRPYCSLTKALMTTAPVTRRGCRLQFSTLARRIAVRATAILRELRIKRNDLKRLWWALVIRDRLIALGMRRPLQILPNSFDVAVHQPLSVDDFTDEINASEVYEAETKTVLCKILTSLCLLTAPLTKIIQISYPSHSRPQRRRADASALEVVQHHLYDWEHSQAVKLRKEHEKKPNNSTDFYNKLTTLYYE